MKRNKRVAAVAWAVAAMLLLAVSPAFADWALNMPRGATQISHEVYGLHMEIFWIVVVIGVIVFGAIFYSVLRHRKSRGVKPATFHHSTAVEIAWTVVPLLILVSMAVPATRTLIQMDNTRDAGLTVKITGYQWKWRYTYMDKGVDFFSTLDAKSNAARRKNSGIDPASVDHYLRNVDHPLVVPTNTKVRFLITSDDVIHSWWVPDLGWKKDAIPGYVNKAWTKIDKPGVYRGQCAELCGRGHAFMPIVVVAKKPDEFKKWLAEHQKKGGGKDQQTARNMTAGETVAAR
ncbi:MAG TPA: cytochrome c oxidase subunit II [Gammaproteobacteria bacterium]|nr:cytochrome c oxidase subunit II [Gammaproteobacteria bacterium]